VLNQERARLAREGDIELRNRTRELEMKLASLLRTSSSRCGRRAGH